jgi:hypothetical protein
MSTAHQPARLLQFPVPTLVRFDCDCIGVRADGYTDIVIAHCTAGSGDPGYDVVAKDMSEKKAVPLSGAEATMIVLNLGGFAREGYKWLRLARDLAGTKT